MTHTLPSRPLPSGVHLQGLSPEAFLEACSLELASKQGTTGIMIERQKRLIREIYGIGEKNLHIYLPVSQGLDSPLCPLDHVLYEVIRTGNLIEISGEAGTGKTRLLLRVIATVLLTTEYEIAFIVTVIDDVLGMLIEFINQLTRTPLSSSELTQLLQRLHFLREVTPSSLTELFNPRSEVWQLCLTRPNLKLLCLDSVGFLRILYANTSATTNVGATLGQYLRRMASIRELAILVTNQVADYIPTATTASSANQRAEMRQFPGQGIPGALPHLPSNTLEDSNTLYIYSFGLPASFENNGSNLWLSDPDASYPLLMEHVEGPIGIYPRVSFIPYRAQRTYYRDVVMSSGKLVTPSLGLNWADNLDTRIMLALGTHRLFHVLWSPHLSAASGILQITSQDMDGQKT
ncbi:hypothetical protein GMRT_14514 [Giardia muris]|uniref:Uncharacterized protein n=1 Tax=Giardia muris TaxID=5742 RepID=A0A4Z1T7W3_GIAMU|nr:hypothetical protein GMRT_14514 [Giardia muris]|eukprot:TNJ29247.1 hypothetical protein GMRT_14514 [Giardia muris]